MNETLLINGIWRAALSTKSLPIINPAYGAVIASVADAGPEDVDAAVRAAAAALPQWSATKGRERATLMHRAMDNFRSKYLDETARILTQENGKPLNDSIKECSYTADVIDFYADESRRITGTHFAGDMGNTHSFVTKEPVGVVAAILPWNFPVDLLAWKIGPGLAAGCTFVIKPSEEAPLAVLKLVQAFLDAGLPNGVLNVLTGGRATGATLVQHPDVQKIAFTGSLATGQWIGQQAALQMKRVTLELGGSSPFIVCDDANIEVAAQQALRRCFSHTGQICISVNRIYAHHSIFDEFTQHCVALTRKLRVASDGLHEPSADMGPMISAAGVVKVESHVSDAQQKGAKVLVGGNRPKGIEYSPDGYFYNPTVLIDVSPEMKVMSEETFGPVAPIASFIGLEEAVNMANNTPYGLAAYIFTNDMNRAFYAARHLRFGGVGVNVNDITDIRGAFGGMKQSGIGRELGVPGLDSYLETKHIRFAYQDPK
ncbi:MAG: NAD-dependent succinate-semialdehyde dehydrogenase [Anaerolineae bacterium]